MSQMEGRNMTSGDFQFMKEMGIALCHLDDPFPISLPLPPVPKIPTLSEKDACWLQNLGVMWEQDPEPEFDPPKALRDYLGRFPSGIRTAVGEVATEMELALPHGGLDNLAREITQMFLDFAALGLEDVVELYGFYQSMRPGLCGAGGFHTYVKLRVAACVPVVLGNDPTRTDALGESLGS